MGLTSLLLLELVQLVLVMVSSLEVSQQEVGVDHVPLVALLDPLFMAAIKLMEWVV